MELPSPTISRSLFFMHIVRFIPIFSLKHFPARKCHSHKMIQIPLIVSKTWPRRHISRNVSGTKLF